MTGDSWMEHQMKKIILVGFSSNLTQKTWRDNFLFLNPSPNLPPSVTVLNYYSSPIVSNWLSVFAWPTAASLVLPLISNLSLLVCLMSASLSIFSKRLSGHVFNSTARATLFPSPRCAHLSFLFNLTQSWLYPPQSPTSFHRPICSINVVWASSSSSSSSFSSLPESFSFRSFATLICLISLQPSLYPLNIYLRER